MHHALGVHSQVKEPKPAVRLWLEVADDKNKKAHCSVDNATNEVNTELKKLSPDVKS